jgi:protein-L-isoaspartate(D-aspartate) O-methyltransferase
MIQLLARRGLAHHPWRSCFLLLGFALGGAVMIILLSVGEAILEQARDVDLLGGGDLVLLPEGVDLEALKVGGLTAMYFQIANARPLVALYLEGPRWRSTIETVSPILAHRVVYVGRQGRAERWAALATGTIPEREERLLSGTGPAGTGGAGTGAQGGEGWIAPARAPSPEQDAFHVPPSGGGRDSLWAEWHYFNLRRGPEDPYGTLSFMVAGDQARGRGAGIVSAQWREVGGRTWRASQKWEQDRIRFSTTSPDLTIGPCRVEVEPLSGRYRLFGRLDPRDAEPFLFDLTLTPDAGFFFPPLDLDGGGQLGLGYVIPVLRGRWDGWIQTGGRRHVVTGFTGYHDHNWGTWDRVAWDWGQATTEGLALFYGTVRSPVLTERSGFLAVTTAEGVLQSFRLDAIERRGRFPADGMEAPVPAQLLLRAGAGQDSIRVAIASLDAVETTLAGEDSARFVQILGRYDVSGSIGGRPIRFTEIGFAEVFAGGPAEIPLSAPAETSAPEDPEYGALRQRMVEAQIASRGIRDPQVLSAMGRVPRHRFVAPGWRPFAYDDGPLPIGYDQTISQPYIVALMTELARVRARANVLDIGTGSGYQAAVLAEIGAEVASIEILCPLAEEAAARLRELGYGRIEVRCGDGYRGWPERAPFDAIILAAAPDHVPESLVEQLAPGGRLVLPVGEAQQELIVIEKLPDGGVRRERVLPVRFVPMTGEAERRRGK